MSDFSGITKIVLSSLGPPLKLIANNPTLKTTWYYDANFVVIGWIGFHLFNDDTRPSGHISRLFIVTGDDTVGIIRALGF